MLNNGLGGMGASKKRMHPSELSAKFSSKIVKEICQPSESFRSGGSKVSMSSV